MPSSTTLEVCRKHLYSEGDKIPIMFRERIKRIRVGYTFWYEFPTKSEMEIRDHLMNEFGVSKTMAYEDIHTIKILLGDLQNPGKEWIRFQTNAMFDAAYKIAEKKEDAKGMAIAAANKAKYNMLHIPDHDPLPFDQIAIQQFEPTDDPSSLGLKKDPDLREKKKRMLEKYHSDIEITDVPFDEMTQPNVREEEGIF